MGFFAGLDRDSYDRQYKDTYLLRRLGNYFANQNTRIVIIVVTGLLLSLVQAATPIIISIGIEEIANNTNVNDILLLIGALLVTVIVQYGMNWWRRRVTGRFIGDMTSQMRKDAFKAAVDRDMAFYDKNKTGKILSRITSDTEEFGQILLVTSDLVSQLIQVFVLLAVLIWQDLLLTAILFVFLIPMFAAIAIFRRLARIVTRQGSRAMAAVNDNIQETVTGISVSKNFRQEAAIYQHFEQVNRQSYRINMQRGAVLAMVFPVLNALVGFAFAAILYGGAVAVVNGAITISIWYLYIQAIDRFWFPIINVASYWSQFQQAISSLERIFALIDAENTVNQSDTQSAESIKGKIEFTDLSFAYLEGQPILNRFNLTIEAGQSVAFVGHTGAGKSSIAKLIMRFYEFQDGQLLIDGHDIRTFDIQSYRRRLGFVPQTPFLFSGSILENIRYGRPAATDADIEAIAYSIGNGEWMETLPEGLHTSVGERGARLSIGQRQLVSLLRVLVQKPAIFILDEATASVDPFTEMQIQEAIHTILAQATSILIAHRLSTVKRADKIIVLKQGEIIETGSHDSLMEQGGHYSELYNTYFRHQSLSYIENSRLLLAGD